MSVCVFVLLFVVVVFLGGGLFFLLFFFLEFRNIKSDKSWRRLKSAPFFHDPFLREGRRSAGGRRGVVGGRVGGGI